LKNNNRIHNNFKDNPFSGHEFKKSLGQNFLRDKNLLKSIVKDAGVTADSVVLEVGAGAGTLTREIASEAGIVVSMEVDRTLESTLLELEKEFNNLKIWYSDALKTEDCEIVSTLTKFAKSKNINTDKVKVVANIPYYITTPLIFKFLKMEKVSTITIMVQKEVAERIVSSTSSGEYGALSVMVNFYGKPTIKRVVDKSLFYPVPKVDSAVLHIEKYELIDFEIEQILTDVVKCAFSKRRKMLINNLSEQFGNDKPCFAQILENLNIKPTVRAEELTIDQYINLSKEIAKLQQN